MSDSKPVRRVRIYTADDVASHSRADDCWVTRAGRVYNVTPFLNDHPGGDDLILRYAGKDIDGAMEDPDEHSHSASAFEMLDEYLIGKIGTSATIVNEDWVPEVDFHPDDTDVSEDFEKCQFLDLRRPLVTQVLYANFSKSFYLQQVHQPRHLAESARLFGPDWMEVLTRTPWYVVPIFWLPITTFLFCLAALQSTAPSISAASLFQNPFSLSALFDLPMSSFLQTGACFLLGNVIWTILEYALHRFLFHIDDWLPDRPIFLMLHFLTHGVHHFLPMDRLRLVMPPTLFAILQFPFTRLAYVLFPVSIANGIISGAFAFYILYDLMHYALHHTKLPEYMREMKKYHLAHHYKNFELGFGVTSKIWDIVFNTVLPV
ncbi:hypothetical protein BOTBODRAFT_118073 [Botryobasidium botryosum FD-172 SS1]|uniref:Ceramide very long chain fatty acid hydroxylase n=1 Tax=Botryobasidium botryosum (strain FD-172 SS1) TaxID=930990 RepID=A0A067MA97_BOTB1|nr:hypothetical protein BOTBODRAFT_118073 [Botryobasidium botryosum FD-172 SS1]